VSVHHTVVSTKTKDHMIVQFHHPVAHGFLPVVLLDRISCVRSQGTPCATVSNETGSRKNRLKNDFCSLNCYNSKIIEDNHTVTMED